MKLVERADAIATLDGLLASAVCGKGRIAVIAGAVASGKTELLHTYADRAVDRDALAITAIGADTERDLPFGVLTQLLLDAPLVAEEQQRAMNLLYEGARADDCDHKIDPQIVHALGTILLELSHRYPLIVAVDDIDRADRQSLVCLSYLARRARFAPILLLFTQTEQGRRDEIGFEMEALWRPPHGSRIVLPALSAEAVRELAASQVGEADAERLVPAWQHLSGGSPMLLRGLLDDHREAPAAVTAAGSEPVTGEHFARAVVSCLHRTNVRVRRVAQGLAVCADVTLLDQLVQVDDAQISQAVRTLTTIGVLSGGAFRHPAARAAVLADLDELDRVDLFGRAAVLAHRGGACSTVVAAHLVGAGEVNGVWALPVLEDAARQSLREGQVAAAVRYLQLALRACTDSQRRARITAALVRAEWRINPSAPTGYLPELAAALRGGQLRGVDALVLTKALLWHGQFAEAREAFELIGAHHGDADAETRAELVITRPLMLATYPSFRPLLHPGTQPPVAMPTVSTSHRLSAATALAGVLRDGPSERATTVAERILRNSRLDEMSLDTVESALLTLTYGGCPASAAGWCDTFVDEARMRRSPSRQARLAAIRAEISMRLGDLVGARQRATDALTVLPSSSWGVAVGGPLAVLIMANTATGDFGTVRDHLDQPVPEEMFQTRFGLHYLYARGRHSLAIGELPLALRDFRRCGQLAAQWGMDTPGLVPWRVDAAETLLRMNSPEQAQQLVAEQLNRCGDGQPRVRAMALRLYAACGELRHRPMFLRQSADLHNGGDDYELARTLVDLTEALRALGESRRVRLIARRARATAEKVGALPLLNGLKMEAGWDEEESADAISPIVAVAVLSEAEHRVAALAAAGYSNREISEKLYITVSTVEQHLTRTYRKLNVARRGDLPASLSPDYSASV
ncbi:helix-turn-helix domain-containing protein [Micromonospora sp. HNM0581]|uniref:AAA family ATPase n=1 Tax=Micromonospora sp. HNM0581 TaxID=2716341 RepID=UPI00146C9208|nr:LuxR family transcriptional regulator [Micromonospora sp. HNM0581]NLU78458.1 helix-turn-helix domain-containing protein [Micromonospora sp. HNM0581]